jgi:hypothetical protein
VVNSVPNDRFFVQFNTLKPFNTIEARMSLGDNGTPGTCDMEKAIACWGGTKHANYFGTPG